MLIDIKDLDLSLVPEVKDTPIVSVSKHLCGCATDLTLRCLSQPKVHTLSTGIVIALCCHHACTYEDYINLDFLEQNQISSVDFLKMCVMSNWATCGNVNEERWNEKTQWPNLSFSERRELGLMTKRVIDIGRVLFLESVGYTAELIYYCDRQHSLENAALIARKRE